MLKDTAEDYKKYLEIDFDKKLIPIHQSVDDMLTRLEEFETLLTIVQQERCNAVGLTGSLTQALDGFGEVKELANRIDALEKLIQHITSNVDAVERKVEAAEEQFGLTENTVKIKKLFMPLFQRSGSVREQPVGNEMEIFSTEDYFSTEGNNDVEDKPS